MQFLPDIFWKPFHVAHDVAHVHEDLELLEADREHDQRLPRVSRRATDPSLLLRMNTRHRRNNNAWTTVARIRRYHGASSRRGSHSGSNFDSNSRILRNGIVFRRIRSCLQFTEKQTANQSSAIPSLRKCQCFGQSKKWAVKNILLRDVSTLQFTIHMKYFTKQRLEIGRINCATQWNYWICFRNKHSI